ncbi:MAG: PD-(D/E)XK nuclease family protein [Bacteroidota bacterium]
MEFLKKVAAHLLKNDAETLTNLCVVLPNRRANVFLKKYISAEIYKATFLPRITSIQDFVIELSGTTIIDEYTSLVELYKSYAEVKTKDTESFDDFLKWGSKLLHDFDEIDQQLADAHFVFTYLKEEKNLALWALDKKPLSEFQQNYLKFYEILYDIYVSFTNRIAAKGLANYGMACRIAVNRIQDSNYKNKYCKILFAGLNALSTAEKTIIEFYLNKQITEILWDADDYYIKNTTQEAGNFIRSYQNQWKLKETNWTNNTMATDEKEIIIVGIAGNVGQVKYTASEIANLLKKDSKSENISVILNEESLLIPMLNSIPEGIDKFNITMGFPMKFSPVFTLFEIIFTMHENAERFKNSKNASEPLYYFYDLQKLLGHSFFIRLFNSATKNKLVAQLLSQKKVFYTHSEIIFLLSNHTDKIPDSVRNIFVSWFNQSKNAIECLIRIMNDIKICIPSKQCIEQELLYEAHKVLNMIKASEKESGIKMTPQTLHRIFKQYISQSTVPFVGEPLNGLQIMGMLETRALDFETVFMLSVNEGILPSAKTSSSFIPYSIRQDSGLTTFVHNEQIFAYHFYHVLQRSKKIYLIYNTQADDFGGGERSRFINQIINELPKYNPQIKISEEFIALPPLINNQQQVSIRKDADILKKLDAIAETGLSPSALNMFRKCSLQYYFTYIAGIKEADELTEIMDNKEFGTQIHEVLKTIFKSTLNQELTIGILEKFLNEYENILSDNYQADNKNTIDRMSGKNLLIYYVIKDYLRDFLEKQIEVVQSSNNLNECYRVLMIEERLESEISLTLNNSQKTVKLIGTIDRVDSIGNVITIIDYKTGDTKSKYFDFEKLLTDEQNMKNDYIFQLLSYAWLYNQNAPTIEDKVLHCGVWGFKNLSEGLKLVQYASEPKSKSKQNNISAEILTQFENLLKDILVQLFSPDVDFVQTENDKNCENCIFVAFCGK